MNCLLVCHHQNTHLQPLSQFLQNKQIDYDICPDSTKALTKVRDCQYDIIVIDSQVGGIEIDTLIRLFSDYNKNAKIIISTESNSKDLESKIRREKIFYYHIRSFGLDDLFLALTAASGQNASKAF